MEINTDQIDLYVNSCQARGLSDHSIRAYRSDLKKFLHWVAKVKVDGNPMTGEVVSQWLDAMYEEELSPATVKRRLASLRAWAVWLAEKGELGRSIPAIPKVKLPFQLPKNLMNAELSALMETSCTDGEGPKDQLLTLTLIEVLFQTGIRIGEACGIKIGDYDLYTGSIRILGKGNKERTVFIVNSHSQMVLKRYLGSHPDNENPEAQLFLKKAGSYFSTDTARRLLRKHAKRVGLKKRVTPHMLRHSAATELIAHGADIRSVQRLLGHSSLAVTEIYTHVTDTQLKDTLSRVDPRAFVRKPADN